MNIYKLLCKRCGKEVGQIQAQTVVGIDQYSSECDRCAAITEQEKIQAEEEALKKLSYENALGGCTNCTTL